VDVVLLLEEVFFNAEKVLFTLEDDVFGSDNDLLIFTHPFYLSWVLASPF